MDLPESVALFAPDQLEAQILGGQRRATRLADERIRSEELAQVEGMVGRLLREGRVRTPDLGGSAKTTAVGDAICTLAGEKELVGAR